MRTVIQNQSYSTDSNGFNADTTLVLDSKFTGCNLEGAVLADAVIVRCQFNGVSLYLAWMFRTVFLECSFVDVDFRGANMEQCMFVRCTLSRCDFSRDNLGGETDLSEVSFADSKQTGCKYDSA